MYKSSISNKNNNLTKVKAFLFICFNVGIIFSIFKDWNFIRFNFIIWLLEGITSEQKSWEKEEIQSRNF